MTTTPKSVASMSTREFLDAVSSDAPVPGGGGVAATVGALAAALAGMAGRYAIQHDPESTSFRALVERVDGIRDDAIGLADDDADAYGRYVEASHISRDPDPEIRRQAVHEALDAAAEVPYRLAGLAADIAAAGEELSVSGDKNLRSDACIATLLASAVANGAAILVGDNLHARQDDPRLAEVGRRASEATSAATRALASLGRPRDADSP
jgi:formiminotetrahydrofolate cyclodeaminase